MLGHHEAPPPPAPVVAPPPLPRRATDPGALEEAQRRIPPKWRALELLLDQFHDADEVLRVRPVRRR